MTARPANPIFRPRPRRTTGPGVNGPAPFRGPPYARPRPPGASPFRSALDAFDPDAERLAAEWQIAPDDHPAIGN
jgi:hypothetical protein